MLGLRDHSSDDDDPPPFALPVRTAGLRALFTAEAPEDGPGAFQWRKSRRTPLTAQSSTEPEPQFLHRANVLVFQDAGGWRAMGPAAVTLLTHPDHASMTCVDANQRPIFSGPLLRHTDVSLGRSGDEASCVSVEDPSGAHWLLRFLDRPTAERFVEMAALCRYWQAVCCRSLDLAAGPSFDLQRGDGPPLQGGDMVRVAVRVMPVETGDREPLGFGPDVDPGDGSLQRLVLGEGHVLEQCLSGIQQGGIRMWFISDPHTICAVVPNIAPLAGECYAVRCEVVRSRRRQPRPTDDAPPSSGNADSAAPNEVPAPNVPDEAPPPLIPLPPASLPPPTSSATANEWSGADRLVDRLTQAVLRLEECVMACQRVDLPAQLAFNNAVLLTAIRDEMANATPTVAAALGPAECQARLSVAERSAARSAAEVKALRAQLEAERTSNQQRLMAAEERHEAAMAAVRAQYHREVEGAVVEGYRRGCATAAAPPADSVVATLTAKCSDLEQELRNCQAAVAPSVIPLTEEPSVGSELPALKPPPSPIPAHSLAPPLKVAMNGVYFAMEEALQRLPHAEAVAEEVLVALVQVLKEQTIQALETASTAGDADHRTARPPPPLPPDP